MVHSPIGLITIFVGWIRWNHVKKSSLCLVVSQHVSEKSQQEMGAELFEKMKAFIMSRSKGAKSKLWRLDKKGRAYLGAGSGWVMICRDAAMESYTLYKHLQTSTNIYKHWKTGELITSNHHKNPSDWREQRRGLSPFSWVVSELSWLGWALAISCDVWVPSIEENICRLDSDDMFAMFERRICDFKFVFISINLLICGLHLIDNPLATETLDSRASHFGVVVELRKSPAALLHMLPIGRKCGIALDQFQ